MNLHVINTGYFKLDGGAMFGVVPQPLWKKLNPPDERNLCTWALRCLAIEDGERLILIDNGIGDKQSEKFFSHYFMHGDASLEGSLKTAGFALEDVTDNFLTHLHFDHCGGGVRWQDREAGTFAMTFPKAQYWTNEAHWDWATQPNPREKASFLKENLLPMQESGHLQFIDPLAASPFSQFDIIYADGHTEKQMLPKINYGDRTIVFAADLLPSQWHVPMPWVMAYDVRPLVTMQEKAPFLEQAADEQWIIFFEHDPVAECATLKRTEKGIRIDRTFPL
ncbi:MAG TPA: MBL fold metallo-hydrolase, partial [Cytophagales bacterium]|nr:MBL fold metallo-hydrolase [Cytophagales bacterium]